MSAEYTPTTEEVRTLVAANASTNPGAAALVAAFDRWLESLIAQVRVDTLRVAAEDATGGDGYAIRQRLLDRADRIEATR